MTYDGFEVMTMEEVHIQIIKILIGKSNSSRAKNPPDKIFLEFDLTGEGGVYFFIIFFPPQVVVCVWQFGHNTRKFSIRLSFGFPLL